MKTTEVNLRDVKVFDLMGQPVLLPTPFVRDFGNAIYIEHRDIERQDLGRKVFMSEKEKKPLMMNENELTMFVEIFEKMSLLNGLLHNSIVRYLNNKIENLKSKKDDNNSTEEG